MLTKIGLLTGISLTALSLTSFSAEAQTVQQGTQEASIQGNNNEINQIINQYHFANPGKGVLKRREPVPEFNNSQTPSSHRNPQLNNSNQREWGHDQGEQRRRRQN